MNKIKFLLTFDYELPLGYCYDYSLGLFAPTDKLLSLAKENEFPIVLFADICSAIKFESWDYDGYYVPFANQIKSSLKQGNDVQLHIHPHWFDSTYMDGKFFPSKNFSLSKFKDHPSFPIERIIQLSFDKLVDIATEEIHNYKCIAFRAGGYDVEPASSEILSKLYDLGICFESSVIKGLFLDHDQSKIDYRIYPETSRWHISKNGPVNRSEGNDLLELPISSRPSSFADVVIRRIKKTLFNEKIQKRVYDNKGGGYHLQRGKQLVKNNLRQILNPHVLSVDKANYELEDLRKIVDYNLRSSSNENSELILTLIGHPKSMGAYNRELLLRFVDSMRKRFKDQAQFTTYNNLFKEGLR